MELVGEEDPCAGVDSDEDLKATVEEEAVVGVGANVDAWAIGGLEHLVIGSEASHRCETGANDNDASGVVR